LLISPKKLLADDGAAWASVGIGKRVWQDLCVASAFGVLQGKARPEAHSCKMQTY